MGQRQLEQKITDLLTTPSPFKDEPQVLYFLVESRKILDKQRAAANSNLFPVLRFYADWSVHTEKNQRMTTINQIVQKLDTSIKNLGYNIEKIPVDNPQSIADFVLMIELRKEILAYLKQFKLPKKIFSNNSDWLVFVNSLIGILNEQPLMNPSASIRKILLNKPDSDTVTLIIEFNDARGDIEISGSILNPKDTIIKRTIGRP
jgi:hypothetical protein